MSSSYCKGVTLIEMIVVVTIIAVFSVVALPSFTSSEKYQLEAATQQFVDAIRFARNEAIRTGNTYGVYIRDDLQKISVYRADTSTTPPTPIYDVYHPIKKNLYTIDLKNDSVIDELDLITPTSTYQGGTCDSPRYINFNPNSYTFCGDPHTLHMRQSVITFNLGEHSRNVTLYGATGRVEVQ